MKAHNIARTDYDALDESELVRLARAGDRESFRSIMRRGNQWLFRVARSIVRDDAEAEDVVQEAYVRAFINLNQFRGDASIFTWLTRITINEANGRLLKRRNMVGLDYLEAAQESKAQVIMFPNAGPLLSPEDDAARAQIRRLIEAAIDSLPEAFRAVFVLRDVEECSVAETAQYLNLREETVKTRLHRARRRLRVALSDTLASTMADAYPFLGRRCERLQENVMARLALAADTPSD